MKSVKIKTNFLSPDKNNTEEIEYQSSYFSDMPFLQQTIDFMPDIVLILNKNRQIVLANNALQDFAEKINGNLIYGRRPGEVLNCVHAYECDGGCGTTEFCRKCGAANAIVNSLNGTPDEKECRVIQKDGLGSLDLKIKSSLITIRDEQFLFFIVTDISHKKRRRALERIFFHDILNTAGNIRGLFDILRIDNPELKDEYAHLLHCSIETMIEEIKAQKDLNAAEGDDLSVNLSELNTIHILKEITNIYQYHKVALKRFIKLDDQASEVEITSDKIILSRILSNMVKNALEASEVNETVTIGCESDKTQIRFWVHNPKVMEKDVQLQIFQRSFSTKSVNRGLGTYSMKLLAERYLEGTVSFSSSLEKGTVFSAVFPLTLAVDN